MYDDNEATEFELNPLGARQRVIPGRRFKAVASKITKLVAEPAPEVVEPIIDEHMFVTERVPRLPPPRPMVSRSVPPPFIVRTNVRLTARLPMTPHMPPAMLPVLPSSRLARVLARFALPIGGLAVMVLLSLYLMLPGHARDLSARIAPLGAGSGETPTETFQLTTSVDEPPDEPEVVVQPTPERAHRAGKPRHVVAVDSSTPLGNLRPRKW